MLSRKKLKWHWSIVGNTSCPWTWISIQFSRLTPYSNALRIGMRTIQIIYIHFPPSTTISVPLMNCPSSLAKNKTVLAISFGSVRRPRGTCAMKFFLFSGVSGTPVNISKSPVPERRGQTELTRMLCGPYSAARPFVAYKNQIGQPSWSILSEGRILERYYLRWKQHPWWRYTRRAQVEDGKLP